MSPSSAASAAPSIGGLTYLRELGSGGYADVFLYEQDITRMRVAVKVLSGEGISEEVTRRFTAEANTMAELADHPNIVQVFQANVTGDGRPYIVMKYYPQQNLAVRARMERLAVTEVLSIGIKISCAVETAHRAGILHRDIKPANILTSQYAEPGLTDFGIATTTGDEGASEAEGMSIPWAPPEVLWGTGRAEKRSDVYGLGATLWHLLVGHSPFEVPGGDNSFPALMKRIWDGPPPKTGREDVPASLERLLSQVLAKDPSVRPPTALSLARALQGIEIEQRWTPTPLVLLEEASRRDRTETAVDPAAPDATSRRATSPLQGRTDPPTPDQTRLRPPQRVIAQMPTFVSPKPSAPVEALEGETMRRGASELPGGNGEQGRSRPGVVPEAPAAGTVRRAVQVQPDEPPKPERRPSTSKAGPPKKLIAAAALVVVIAVGLGVILANGKSGKGTPVSSPNTAANAPGQDATAGEAAAPGVPVVTSSRISSSEVKFSWTYANRLSSDQFQWRVVGGVFTPTIVASATVADPSGQQVCIEVQVARADGSDPSPLSQATCGG